MQIHHETKRNKLGALVITLLILAFVASLSLAYASAEETSGQIVTSETGKFTEIPGAPDNVVQYNYTDITPEAQMEQVAAGEPTLFQYRNMTMLMNCSQNCEMIFTATPQGTPKIFGLSLDPNQTMTLTMNLSGSPLEGEKVMERTLNFYLGLEPNITTQLNAQIRLYINQTQFNQDLNRVVNASRLTWMYWNRTRSEWETVESYMDENGYLVCHTDHFSTWTVAEIDEAEVTLQLGLDQTVVYVAISAIVVVVFALGIVVIKKRS